MISRSILTKILTFFLIFMMGFTVVPGNLTTWLSMNNISDPPANQVFAALNSGVLFPIKSAVLLQFEGNVLDSSQSHNNGIVTGNAKYVAGKIGNYSFSFDGLTHVTLANPSDFAFDRQNPFAISFWMKMAPNNSTDMYLISNANTPTSAGISIFKSHLSNGLTFKVQTKNNVVFWVSSTYNVSDNSWHLVMCTYDGSSSQRGLRIYIDGALQAAGTAANSAISTTLVTNLNETIGSTVSGASPYIGTLDNLQILTYLPSSTYVTNFFGKPQLFSPILLPTITTKSAVSLSWLPVIGAVGYDVYRDGVNITRALEPYPSYVNFGLQPSTTHRYSIVAVNSTGGTSQPSKVNATTLSTSLNTPLRVISFPIDISSDDIGILKTNLKPADGITSARIPYIESLQDLLQIPDLNHFPFSPRIGELSSSCTIGSVPSISEQVAQSTQANQSGYHVEAIVYDIEPWCWTPDIEQQHYVSAIDNASKIAHGGGFKFGIVPTHVELIKWYPNINWKNVDYLFIQDHKGVMTRESGYALFDPNYISDTTNIINYSKSQNPTIKIFLTFNLDWEPVGSAVYGLNQFKNQIQGVDFYNVPPNNAINNGAPHPTWNTPSHQNQFLKALKGM